MEPVEFSKAMNRQAGVPGGDSFGEVVSAIQIAEGSTMSVPALSALLGVKTTTLNARFRRENTAVRTIGRTNFISHELALRLAQLHKYALMGWPTLKRASELTGVKSATLKAWCESGQLEAHIDLTKRLRIAPSALESLQPLRKAGVKRNAFRFSPPAAGRFENAFRAPESSPLGRRDRLADSPSRIPPESVLRPAPEPQIRILTRKDYGLPEIEEVVQPSVDVRRSSENKNHKKTDCLSYDPDMPFSVSECSVGRRIRYAQYDGTILRIIDDPFNPQIQVAFPGHQHPLMKEVLLIVGRRG